MTLLHYCRNMPDIEILMQEWPPGFEGALKEVCVAHSPTLQLSSYPTPQAGLPGADLDCSLEQYTDIVCGEFTLTPSHPHTITPPQACLTSRFTRTGYTLCTCYFHCSWSSRALRLGGAHCHVRHGVLLQSFARYSISSHWQKLALYQTNQAVIVSFLKCSVPTPFSV